MLPVSIFYETFFSLFFYFALQLIVMDLNLAGAQVTEIEYRCELMLYTTRFSQGI